MLDEYTGLKTSGSTGKSLPVLRDEHRNLIHGELMNQRLFGSVDPELLNPSKHRMAYIIHVSFGASSYNGFIRMRSVSPDRMNNMKAISVMESIDKIVEELNEFQPETIVGYPSSLMLLANEKERGTLNIPVKLIGSSSENLPESTHHRLEKVFGCKVINNYCMTEGGEIAMTRNCAHLHLNEDWIIVEPVHADMTPMENDEEFSEGILVTDLANFVQPFIREQCQKIDYTLYHLDGVGAMHHLPALLEIEELNAIQWTPGVGQPQGGSSKWYDLYRQILEGGKSIMACWVTLDELRPLLDNVGGDGIHLEMDFHNEQEVEQAMKIVDDFKAAVHIPARVQAIIEKVERESADDVRCAAVAPQQNPALSETASSRVLVLDGAMGTMIQRYQLREEDFRGYRFAKHPQTLTGCNDLLSITCPVVVRDIHRRYLEAGADLIETNTFNAQRISLADYGLEDHVRDINLAACELARQAAEDYTTEEKPRYVLGSIGPTSKTTSMSTGKEPALDKNTLKAAYREQIDALIDGGVDALLIETIFDVENARLAIKAAQETMQQKGKELPIMLSFSVSTPDGHNMLGQSIFDFLDSLSCDPFSVGINCYADVSEMLPLLQQLGARYPYRISAYPNAGMPDGKGQYNKTPEQHQQDLWPLLDGHIVDILGGCCGTTDQFIAKIAELAEPAKGCYISSRPTPALPMREGANTFAKENVTTSKTNNSLPHREGRGGSGGSGDSVVSLSVFSSILSGNAADCATATKAAITSGASPQDIINGEMIRAMSEVGQRFQDGKAFVPQLLMAGRAMKAGLEELKPLMAGQDATSIGKVVIGTVKGDLHDIGKNLVASMLEGCGFEVINIGIDVSADKFIEEVKKNQPDILCMSALLTTTMGYMKEVIDALEKAGIRDRVKVMVGGAPVSQGFADEIGADGYSDNANTAVQVAKQLLG